MLPEQKENGGLSTHRFNKEIIQAVIAQLEKDVLLCGGTLKITENSYTDLELLKEEVQYYLSSVSVVNPTLLFNLLYRIDIPQKMLDQQTDDLGTLVLKRELTKVLIRLSYK